MILVMQSTRYFSWRECRKADDNVAILGDKVMFYHNGCIGFSNKGSGKIDELRQFVLDEHPSIIDGNRFNLGTLINNRLWNLDDPEVMALVENLISDALIRDEYRNFLRSR